MARPLARPIRIGEKKKAKNPREPYLRDHNLHAAARRKYVKIIKKILATRETPPPRYIV